ncbi:SPOR domain-containing protein [Salaquimonas pukyongi]|uniref:SPOR domain-containing protein n=1 Tax=Salaquimonas pukyongi TaxID=2712698 RepID=UPI00096BCF6E|nr:hypothetical protein [Salaquimonas pukyongi]
MNHTIKTLVGAAAIAIAAGYAMPVPQAKAQSLCGHYVVLGCFKTLTQAQNRLTRLGGPGVGGWAGARVVNTNEYPNFRNGWFCVADGPYASRNEAMSIAWKEAVPDAYVKNSC